MESSQPTRILVEANRTTATPLLLEEIRRRAREAPCEFALLIPDPGDRKTADWTLEHAVRLLEREARADVEPLLGASADPFESVQLAVREGEFDEVIVSTLPSRISKWLRRDLIRRVEGLGLPVTAVVPADSRETEPVGSGPGSAGGGAGGIAGGGIL